MSTVNTDFRPQINGHSFANRFEMLSNKHKKGLGKMMPKPVVYGLCGGMCFTALDYYYSGKPMPRPTTVDKISPQFFHYLTRRQFDSLPPILIWKIFRGMVLSDQGIIEKYNLIEIPKITRDIDLGKPVPLILVRGRGLSDPTQNHQVIAVGYEFSDSRDAITIRLYDPNHPHLEPHISQGLTGYYHVLQSTGEVLRGFFLQRYRFKTPPF